MLTSQATLAAVILLGAGIIHNYSFMCRKLAAKKLSHYYPASLLGKTLFNLSWVGMAGYGLVLCSQLSTALFWFAALFYFLALPFLLQPQLARLLGFSSLTEYKAVSEDSFASSMVWRISSKYTLNAWPFFMIIFRPSRSIP